ncbi:MAG: hypothetical protein WBN39_10490 [Flavobacteriaceae bacterium]
MGKGLYIGKSELNLDRKKVQGIQVTFEDEIYYKIENSDAIRPFFMSIVSDSNHWMFISSNGGLSAGRKNSEYALFPYYTDDKITESAEITGSKSIIRLHSNSKTFLWEPFSDRYSGMYSTKRNLYKNVYGNKVIFEEINEDLGMTLKIQWNSSNDFGFVKRTFLENNTNTDLSAAILDGIQNILPCGVTTELQNTRSNLVDAYKRNELLPGVGLGIYALSAIIVDKAEPSEALKANIAWSIGLNNKTHLVSSLQLDDFRIGKPLQEETDIKAEKGAFFISTQLQLPANATQGWMIVANVNQSASGIAHITDRLKATSSLEKSVLKDIETGTRKLKELVGAADGLQSTQDHLKTSRHYANVLYNIMRGGIFDQNYDIERSDFSQYIKKANGKLFKSMAKLMEALPEVFTLKVLREISFRSDNSDFQRLCLEYLPLKFSRRHGDPSRPWNRFSINTRSELDGSKILDYEGNWRDIFQNWEALAHSYPEFIDSMILKFLNATTFEGYNPYRVTKSGFDWEVIEPNDPWSYIGYWGDHQIIYLLKFLEFIADYYPSKLATYSDKYLFVYANVPYRIKPYTDILKNPKDTILFDHDLDHEINQKKAKIGADGALLTLGDHSIYHVNLIEKLLATMLAKCSNFIPEAGIWLNTQRPEWNDANNALVGNGVSMVTLYYLRRFLVFFQTFINRSTHNEVAISKELSLFFNAVLSTLEKHQNSLKGAISDQERFDIMEGLGLAGSDYRELIYDKGYSGSKQGISKKSLLNFTKIMLRYLEHAIEANKRKDHLYHAYNLIAIDASKGTTISYLSEMLEGQVAVLSSGYLDSRSSLALLDSLRNSALYRKDQNSYILYPNKELPRFLDKNVIPDESIQRSKLLNQLMKDDNRQVIEKDTKGKFHFNGNFNNAKSLETALKSMSNTKYGKLISEEKELLFEIFEEVFDHKSFTGRSGTFFGYEGLGSIYWHMVSKLSLAVMECCREAIANGADRQVLKKLMEHYHEINEGIGVHKSPELYGAFPTDPYSHTPAHKGAQQPGMTGQVKEDILTRMAELGVTIVDGMLGFGTGLLKKEEFLSHARDFEYIDVENETKSIPLAPGSLGFTYCQIPVVYTLAKTNGVEVYRKDGPPLKSTELRLDRKTSTQIFQRTAEIIQINVSLRADAIKIG